ncbi:MAG: LLM class flavin-dependent oxidoreductase [Sphingomonadaceae bacterium]|nr:LLM class flavin-dependent oxidoreductase [Sphingomonadaceae bacterium]
MRFSLFINPLTMKPEDDYAAIEGTIRQVALANELGFAGVFLSEHHFSGYNAYANPMVFGARLAAELTEAWLSFATVTPPHYHPARLAEDLNLLDNLMQGRMFIGWGKGGIPGETLGLGYHHDEGADRFADTTKAMFDLWAKKPSDPPLTIDGRFFKGTVHERIVPCAYGGAKHPKIIRATRSESGLTEAANNAWPAFLMGPQAIDSFADKLKAAGHSEEIQKFCLDWTVLPWIAHVAESDNKAMAEMSQPFATFGEWVTRQEALKDDYYEDGNVGPRFDPPKLGDGPGGGEMPGAFGSPDTVYERLKLFEEWGFRHLLLGMQFGGMPFDEVERSMRLFAKEVMPRFEKN